MWGKRSLKLKIRKSFPIILLLLIGGSLFFFRSKPDHFTGVPKNIVVLENNTPLIFSGVTENSVGEFLDHRKLSLGAQDLVFPEMEAKLIPGMMIHVTRAHDVTVHADGATTTFSVLAASVAEALMEAKVTLDDDDIIKPNRDDFSFRGQEIFVTRVVVAEQVTEKPVSFEKKMNEDDALSWRKTVVTQKGEKGIDRLTYRVSTHDGKEVNRKLISTERVKEPVPEIVTQGTYVKLGKSHTGGASWYAFTGTLAAANPWLPKGSYVKVTNLENGKNVIVVINDRGPFVPGRIIDLDKVAFAKIASPGAGVISVKMEEIIN